MKRKIIICTFALVTLLLCSCAQQNDYTTEESSPMISANDAKQIALAQVPGATAQNIREFETGYDNGQPNYECEIYYDQKLYQFEIDRYSGTILEWDVEPISEEIF